MRNRHLWQPSKYALTKRGWRGSRDERELGVSSRLIGDILARTYTEAIEQHARGILLDLGCGKVPLYGAYRDQVSECFCVDWPGTLHQSPCLDCEADLASSMPFANQSFDTLLATDILEHLANPQLLWSEMARVLRDAGKVILGVPFLYWVHEAPHDYHRYTEFQLRLFCRNNGFKVVHLEPYGGSAEVVLDIVGKHLARLGLLSRIHQGLSGAFVSSPMGRKLTRRTAHLFPLGYCLVAEKR